MAGIEISEDVTVNQLAALSGGELLKAEVRVVSGLLRVACSRYKMTKLAEFASAWPCGLMVRRWPPVLVKSRMVARDCGFESHQGRSGFFSFI